MKPFIEVNFIKKYDGEYIHDIALIGLEYSQARFYEDDRYKQLKIGLLIFNLVIGIKS